MRKNVLIIGPNGVGKTKVAYELARRHGGEIVNLDRTYLYRGFPITTGMQDALIEQGVPRHLYEELEPDQVSYSPNDFSRLVFEKHREVLARTNLCISEGGSTLYVPHLLELNRNLQVFTHVIGVRFQLEYDVCGKYRRRIDQAFKDGIVEELKENLKTYQSSYLILECHFSVPIIPYLLGERDLHETKKEILARCLAYKDRQMSLFATHKDIQWVEIKGDASDYQLVESLVF
jgi:tRNA A37 N6-isopentenylltransferase MiaA